MMVLVSVVMSSYNHEKYIGESIESVLNQTFKDLELIITDDCSTDSSPEIIANYQKKDPRVRGIFHQKNMGITKTLNDCLNEVRGKFICFIDSDDLWVKNKLEKQLEILKKDDTKLVWSEGEIINSQGIKTGQLITEFLNAPIKKNGNLFQELLREQFIFRQSLIFKSDYVKDIRFDAELRYVNDHRFMVDLSVDNSFFFISEPLAKYRLHGKNITMRNEARWIEDKIRVRRYFLEKYIDKMSNKAYADINYQIGYYLSRFGKKREAKKFYLEALKIDHSHFVSTLYVALALTIGEGYIGKLMVNSYNFGSRFFQIMKTAVIKT